MFVLGFGSVETGVRKELRSKIMKAKNDGIDIHTFCKSLNAKNDEYDKMSKEEAPERYTNVYVYDNKIHYSHINRRHAFSPDGWALFQVEEDI